MTNQDISQSQKRTRESLSALFVESADSAESAVVFIKSSSDVGVMRNGGRNGARFAPRSLLSFFKKQSQSEATKEFSFIEREVSSQEAEEADFVEAQKAESRKIAAICDEFPGARLVHIGGGHDHIFPLLCSMSSSERVIVINIDAHADTRTDSEPHSGTPFRQFAESFSGKFHLFQAGLHPWANSLSTLSPLAKGEQQILWRDEVQDAKRLQQFFKGIQKYVDKNTKVIFSLDADALAGEIVPGVSAVNGKGLSVTELELLWQEYLKLPLPHAPILGIYELNPVFDSLSGISMRTLAGFLFQTLR